VPLVRVGCSSCVVVLVCCVGVCCSTGEVLMFCEDPEFELLSFCDIIF